MRRLFGCGMEVWSQKNFGAFCVVCVCVCVCVCVVHMLVMVTKVCVCVCVCMYAPFQYMVFP